MIKRVISFSPSKLSKMYLDVISGDLHRVRPGELMNKIISEYYLARYGHEERDKIRKKYIEDFFDD